MVELTHESRAHIFVAALGASSYTYACAAPRETIVDCLGATAQALRFIGGMPQQQQTTRQREQPS